MEASVKPETLVLTEVLANYLLASLTEEEKVGITSRVDEFTGLTILSLPPRFHWVTVPLSSAPSLFRRRYLATVPNGDARIQLVYNQENELREVNVLKPKLQS